MTADTELFDRYRGGDLDSFSQLYDRHCRGLFVYALALTGDENGAEDLVQEIFFRLTRYDRPIGSVQAFLYTSLRNLVKDRHKRASVEKKHLPLLAREGERGRRQVGAALEEMGRLPAEQSEVLVLKVFGDLTFAEIGEVTGQSPSTSASRYRYAVQKLAQRLSEE